MDVLNGSALKIFEIAKPLLVLPTVLSDKEKMTLIFYSLESRSPPLAKLQDGEHRS